MKTSWVSTGPLNTSKNPAYTSVCSAMHQTDALQANASASSMQLYSNIVSMWSLRTLWSFHLAPWVQNVICHEVAKVLNIIHTISNIYGAYIFLYKSGDQIYTTVDVVKYKWSVCKDYLRILLVAWSFSSMGLSTYWIEMAFLTNQEITPRCFFVDWSKDLNSYSSIPGEAKCSLTTHSLQAHNLKTLILASSSIFDAKDIFAIGTVKFI